MTIEIVSMQPNPRMMLMNARANTTMLWIRKTKDTTILKHTKIHKNTCYKDGAILIKKYEKLPKSSKKIKITALIAERSSPN